MRFGDSGLCYGVVCRLRGGIVKRAIEQWLLLCRQV